ncbi:hypothetical protein [Actinacidiphila yeochonensis]|uniref:hypothetical protein n=1 Tax=Actinacidiphila yeochonensis TaxID=89050 RepID=UPI00056AF6B5|nr:hypothetical protein [Actinacidiphila yeochonensis]
MTGPEPADPAPAPSKPMAEPPVGSAEGEFPPAPSEEQEQEFVPLSRRRIALIAVGALAVVAAAVGIGHAVRPDTDGGTPAKAGATPWSQSASAGPEKKAYGVMSGGSHYGSLRLMLLPVPSGWSPGQDVEQYGNDAALDAAQAVPLFFGPSFQNAKAKEEEKQVAAELRFEGAGVRTYTSAPYGATATVEVYQVHNQQLLKKLFANYTQGKDFPTPGAGKGKGPAVDGYPHAACSAPTEYVLQSMRCEDVEGDLLVSVTADSVKPMNTLEIVDLFRQQLDRVKAPGEAV